jgi:hypothetical protein
MTVVSYTNNGGPSTVGRARRKLVGTCHHGAHWTNAVHVLRAAIQNGVGHASPRRSATPDQVGSDIIDRIGELDARSLHVLALTFAMLVKASRRDD